MGLNIFKKRKVPDVLPDLATEELNSKLEGEFKEKEVPKLEFPERKPVFESLQKTDSIVTEINETNNQDTNEEGFFQDLLKDVTNEMQSVDKLDQWYKNKFKEEDMVHQMRSYWENQKPELLIKNVNKELIERLKQKTSALNQKEKEWQEVYFELLSKEEEIRKEEKELKTLLSEFIDVCKKRIPSKGKTRKKSK